MKKQISIHFIGNSHTYYNDMPRMVAEIFESIGIDARVSMQTEGGKDLLYHCARKDATFNIVYGKHDYVVLQEVASSFSPEDFAEGIAKFKQNSLDRSTAQPILYMIWANQGNRKYQSTIIDAYRQGGEALNAPIAPAGEVWMKLLRGNKDLPLYRDDGNHATPLGSYLAAACIFYAITGRERPIKVEQGGEPQTRLGLDIEICKKIHSEACRAAKKYKR
ncbi:MAG: hypothetical protein IJY27_01330 [Clostridia bacterium]|nr:hypothetical protein [Clostridia bacterium]